MWLRVRAARLSDREKRATGDLGKSDRRLKERNHAYDPSKPLHAIDLSEDFDIPTDESPASNKAYEIVRINVQCIRAAHIKAKLEAVKDVKTALKVEGYAQAAAKYGALSTRAEKVAKGTAGVVLSGAKWGFKVGYHHAAAKQQQAELACRGLKISYTGALWNELHEAYVEPVLRGEPIVPTLDFVLEQLSRALEPTARWLDRGVYEWIHRGSGWR